MMRSLLLASLLTLASTAWVAPASAQSLQEESARNQRTSADYQAAIRTNPSFRAKRIEQECGPIEDAALKRDCLATFGLAPPSPTLPISR